MKQFLIGAVAACVVVGCTSLFVSHEHTKTQPVLGASSGNEHWMPEFFYNGLTYYKVAGNIGTSSSSPAVLGTTSSPVSVMHIVIPAGSTSVSASTTAIISNKSLVFVQLEQTTPVAGTTCNSAVNASSSEAVSIFASSTNSRLNGFTLSVASAPLTNPFCYEATVYSN